MCPSCIDRPVTSKSMCQDCGTRFTRCENQDAPARGQLAGCERLSSKDRTPHVRSENGYFLVNINTLKPFVII